MDVTACNFSISAEKNDGSCFYINGCRDASADNYNSSACTDDGSCTYSGQYTFWTANCGFGLISVWVDGVYQGQTTLCWTSGEPVCGDPTNADHIRTTVTLPTSAGVSHHITASGSVSGVWDFWRTYVAGTCLKTELI